MEGTGEIPEDIRRTAQKLAAHCFPSGDTLSVDAIASALLAERERCAAVVEGIDKVGRDWAPGSFMAALRRDIAAAIRS